MAKRLHPLLIPFAALLATLPLFLHGPSCGHDFAFHLLSWQDAAAQFAHGTLHPRWAFLPAWGAGEPRFLFYPPLSWTLGGLLTLLSAHLPGLPPDRAFTLVPAAFTGIALTAAGFGMAHLARRYTSPALATLAGTVYLANPYTLFTAYERTAYAELLAAAWLPLLLAAVLPPLRPPARSAPPLDSPAPPAPDLPLAATAIPLALLWLTNAPAAVLGSYALALIVALRCMLLLLTPGQPPAARRRSSLRLALRATAATTLGLALAAFYILPAALDRKWVTISLANVTGLRPADNTLFHHTADPYHDQVLHTASLLAVTLVAVVTAALLARLLLRRSSPPSAAPARPGPLLLSLAVPTLAALFLLTPWSLPLWQHLPELAFVQFPWRLCALLAPLAVLSLALLPWPRSRITLPVLALVGLAVPLALTLPAASHFRVACDADDRPAATEHLAAALLHHQPVSDLPDEPADEPTDEYTPVTADNDALAHTNPPVRVLPEAAPDDAPPPSTGVPAPAPLHFDLSLQTPAKIVLNLRNFPLWSVQNNGHPITGLLARNDGLLAFALPAGPAHITLHLRFSLTEELAAALSAFALCALPFVRDPCEKDVHPDETPRKTGVTSAPVSSSLHGIPGPGSHQRRR